MCGIFGCIHNSNYKFEINYFKEINKVNSNRGPDKFQSKEVLINNLRIKFGHTRLSILDLSENGNQPMSSSSDRFLITYNGEIYNHLYLRKKIEEKKAINWKSTSDTETLLELFEIYEIQEILNMIEGMFAFAILDKKYNKLFFVRDRVGEKPFYIHCDNNNISFSSDLFALKSLPEFQKKLSKRGLGLLLRHNYIPHPYTIYSNCFKLPPASYIEIDLNKYNQSFYCDDFKKLINSTGVKLIKYWQLKTQSNIEKFSKIKSIDSINLIDSCLNQSINNQLISDVPIGAFLSGGIDSSLIVSIMKKFQDKPKTFTIGFEFNDYNEATYAKNISNYLNTEHTEHILSKKDALDIIPYLSTAFSEPFADSSQIPTMLISKIAKQSVKVVLSGDGGDELFGGYNRYNLAYKYWKYIKLIPSPVLSYISKNHLNNNLFIKFFLNFFMNKEYFTTNRINQIDKIILKISSMKSKYDFYDSLTSEWNQNHHIYNDIESNNRNYIKYFDTKSKLKIEEAMMTVDFKTYLTDDILCKVDRSSMYYGLETRSPFLSKKLIETAQNIPLNYKVNINGTKWILKELLGNYLPANLYNRPKQGFGVPIANWMKNELRGWTEDMLAKNLCDKHSMFNYNSIKKIKDEHFSGKHNHEHKLWSIIQFNNWYINNL